MTNPNHTPREGVEAELLPCPFCQSANVCTVWVRDGRRAHCESCGAAGPAAYHGRTSSAEERAIQGWNRRAPQPVAGPIAGEGAPSVQGARESAVHDLKCWPGPFEEMRVGRKRFEYRKNDRDYREGDILHLREWCEPGQYTGRADRYLVEYVLGGGQFGVPDDYCVMSVLSETTDCGPFGLPIPANQARGLAAHLPSQEWLDREVASDPDLDCEAGRGLADVTGAVDTAGARLAQGIAALQISMKTSGSEARVWVQVALDFLTNDKEALAEGAVTSPPLIPPELAELSARAVPGTWRVHGVSDEGPADVGIATTWDGETYMPAMALAASDGTTDDAMPEITKANAAFIVAACNWVRQTLSAPDGGKA